MLLCNYPPVASSKHESSFHWFSSKTSDRARHGNAINGFRTTTAEIYCLNTTTPFTFSTKLKKCGFHVLFLKTTAEKWSGVCIPTWSGCILQLSLMFCSVLLDVPVLVYMPLPSLVQSTVCAWHEFGLTNKSRVERGPRGFQTAVDVEHGLRLLDCPMVEYYSSLLQQKMVVWSPWWLCIKGNLPGFMEIWFLWCFVAPHREERAFCEIGPLRTIVRMERTGRPSTSF